MLTPTCKCGQIMVFSEGQTKSLCPTKNCGMKWERRPEGYWAEGNLTTLFTPILTSKSSRKRKRKRRKAGTKC